MSREIKDIKKIVRLSPSENPYLTILHPEQKPPHIAFITNGICYSLSVKGKKAINADALIHKFLVNHKKVLFLELDIPNQNILFEDVLTNYTEVDFSETCLSPIKKYLELVLLDSYTQLPFVFNVVEKLQNHHLIKNAFGVNIEGDFKLTEYTKQEVDSCISSNLNS